MRGTTRDVKVSEENGGLEVPWLDHVSAQFPNMRRVHAIEWPRINQRFLENILSTFPVDYVRHTYNCTYILCILD